MNVFVLCTGRCGSTTFIKACNHIRNYTSAHESRSGLIGSDRFQYPENHIEADNRLSWLLGRLDKEYGNDAFYVHLKRDMLNTANSFASRYDRGIIKAYSRKILMGFKTKTERLDVCIDYCETVNFNIEAFLKDKTNKMNLTLENAKEDFKEFWILIGADGDILEALREWDVAYNKTVASNAYYNKIPIIGRLGSKTKRLATKFSAIIKDT